MPVNVLYVSLPVVAVCTASLNTTYMYPRNSVLFPFLMFTPALWPLTLSHNGYWLKSDPHKMGHPFNNKVLQAAFSLAIVLLPEIQQAILSCCDAASVLCRMPLFGTGKQFRNMQKHRTVMRKSVMKMQC